MAQSVRRPLALPCMFALPVYVWSSALQTALAVEHSSHAVLDVSTVRLPTAIVQVKSEVCSGVPLIFGYLHATVDKKPNRKNVLSTYPTTHASYIFVNTLS